MGGGRAEPQCDLVLVEPPAGLEGHLVGFVAEHLLGQRRPVVGQVRLVADDRDTTRVVRPAELLRGPGGGQAAADDQDSAAG